MKVLFISLVLCVFAINIKGSRSNTPLIKNIYRGDGHLEGPHWSVAENALYFVDITGQNVHRLDGDTGNVTTKHFAYGPVSLVVSVKEFPKYVLLSVGSTINLLNWESPPGDNSLRLITAVDLGLPDNRVNDGKADANGRLWFGTMGNEVDGVVDEDKGTLYKLTQYTYGNPDVMVRPVTVSNGLTWTSDNKYMFYIDSPTRNVDVFDFDLETGTLKNRRTLFSFQANNLTGVPDGMTIDSDENLWVATFKGGKVIKIDSRAGKLLEQHNMGVSQVSSVMWGGRDLETLYVTTSRRDLTPAELAQQPDAGSLFAIENTGSKGVPENQFVFKYADKY